MRDSPRTCECKNRALCNMSQGFSRPTPAEHPQSCPIPHYLFKDMFIYLSARWNYRGRKKEEREKKIFHLLFQSPHECHLPGPGQTQTRSHKLLPSRSSTRVADLLVSLALGLFSVAFLVPQAAIWMGSETTRTPTGIHMGH